MIQTKLDSVLDVAKKAAQFERNDKGQYWCGVCNRAVYDCDAHPDDHQYDPKGPCAGMTLRTALREFGIDLPKVPEDENPYSSGDAEDD
jgi:hypothetical protein